MISFEPLWKTLIEKKMSKSKLSDMTGLSKSTIAKMTNGESVTLEVVERVCIALQIPIESVVEIRADEESAKVKSS